MATIPVSARIDEGLYADLDLWRDMQPARPHLSAVIEEALREWLVNHPVEDDNG